MASSWGGKGNFRPPSMNSTDDIEIWLREIEIWQCVTDLSKKKQGPAIYLSLEGKARQACADIQVSDLSSDGGVDVLIGKLKTLYGVDKNQSAFLAYDEFEKFERPKAMNITDYVNEFERLHNKIKKYDMELPDGVLAYRVLKSANITNEKQQLARATLSELTYDNMKKQLKSIFDFVELERKETSVKVEIEERSEDVFYNDYSGARHFESRRDNEVLYNNNNGRGNWRSRFPRRGGGNFKRGGSQNVSQRRRTNPDDPNTGKPSKCVICESIFHWARDCPDSHESRNSEGTKINLLTENVQDDYCNQFLGETLGAGVLDSGCTKTVSGKVWYECYLDTLSPVERRQVLEETSDNTFRFGNGSSVKSLKRAIIPGYISGKPVSISTDIVDSDIPLLLSRQSMKNARISIDFTNDTANILGRDVQLEYTTSGHYKIPIGRPKSVNSTVLLSISDISDGTQDEKRRVVEKLHKQFGHPRSERLNELVKDAGVKDDYIRELVKQSETNCDICRKYKKPSSRPVVGFSLAKNFNETVAMDLKFYRGHIVLHLVDIATRYSAAVVIKSKRSEEIIDAIFRNWIALFGIPSRFLTDNGGEFNNRMFLDMAENMNITVLTTAAESPWSNSITERHNAIISNIMDKVLEDTNCSINVALAWAVSSKNTLQNVYGFSPNQLVFGKNPNLPSLHTCGLPALQGTTSSQLIADHLNALHSARESFICSEASEKMRRALRCQVRPATSLIYEPGDEVYYKRNDSKKWKGPGVVIGRDQTQIFVKHGGFYVRVNPCHIRHVKCKNNVGEKTKENNDLDVKAETEKLEVNSDLSDELSNLCAPNETLTNSEQTPEEVDKNSDPAPMESNTEICVKLPLKGQRIRYKDDSSDWRDAIVLGRAGKSTGVNKNWFNVKNTDNETLGSIDLGVLNWENIHEEVLYNQIGDESLEVTAAKQKEINSWKEHEVYEEVKNEDQSCVSVRWVITEKFKDGMSVIKARLVARGFEESCLDEIRKDSPTCCKDNMRLIFAIIASKMWKINSLDIKAAFLQGQAIDRDIYLTPPPEAGTENVWKLKTTVYGLADAPRIWYLTIKQELVHAGAIMSKYDEALFFWRHDGELHGVICCHVDDFCWGGTELFKQHVINNIRRKFQISQEDCETFRYVGLDVIQNKHEITVNQNNYIKDVKQINLDSKRILNKTDRISKSEARALKGVVGQLNWAANQTRPDISYSACEISVAQKSATVSDLIRANKCVKYLKSEKVQLVFPELGDLSKITFIAFSDASFANLKDAGSQGGFIIFLLGANGNYAPITWQSKKIKRIVKSTIAAETLALIDAAESCCLLRTLLCEILQCHETLPIICITDNKSLYDSVHSTKTLLDKRLKVDICLLRDMLAQGEIQKLRWIEGKYQVADSLTKCGASSRKLLDLLSCKDSLKMYIPT